MAHPLRYIGLAAAGALLGSGAMSACSADSSSNNGAGGGANAAGVDGSAATGGSAASGASSGSGGSGNSGGGIIVDAGEGGTVDPDAACSKFQTEATIDIKPVDIIFIIDNSCSMNEEAAGVQQNISVNFANIIQAAGIDYRVIMISEHGPTSAAELCIGPPLGASSCPSGAPVNNPPIFYPYVQNVESWDGWCFAMDKYDKPDTANLSPNGWKMWLRKEAIKSFVMVTDDRVNCSAGSWSYNDANGELLAAQQFDQDLLARDPSQFGTGTDRNYVWYSIVGVPKNPANPSGIYEPTEPLIPSSSKCSSAVNSSTGNQALSQITGGFRFPVCETASYDAVFQEIAKGVIAGAKVACEFDVPEAPEGKTIDLDTLSVDYSPGGNDAQKQNFTQVADANSCKPGAFYIDQGKITLCPDTCSVVQQDDKAKLAIVVDCLKEIPR